MKLSTLLLLLGSSLTSMASSALELTSNDIHEGERMSATFEFQGSGCQGKNLSPQLTWKDIPAGTKSFALTTYDPDAPTGSGWWHWVVVNIPAQVTTLNRGADVTKTGAMELVNDYGIRHFGGACPPKKHGMHRYQFTVWALPVEKLDIAPDASAAVAGFMLNAMALDKAKLTATYVR
ncbi:YbhB/YbcL family Raf kinase inhibitor-like protein [Vibrio mangrovi]|uniref:Putative kinase inhibitor n=1 Tax=Vibrio mangrovi TaxID=474394 RepID=A0A1Y6IUJ5_9VIBR|nr:YbhB/YbcL family Raf kinase inhibitor-like protein [Vibrio mangrovi]MDW6001299.1 YbhB/YbcL family Raf kinase inhibitor-like protein [Vibrio mangrovi]SMS00681.1 putative kinase inhibitor [Vibrio mangrovi]